MFRPNQIGQLRSVLGRDIHGRLSYAEARDCPFSPINLTVSSQKTSVRADSSASRGSADEMVAKPAKILIPSHVALVIGDNFIFRGVSYLVIACHERYAVSGNLDHFEIDMEMLPQ